MKNSIILIFCVIIVLTFWGISAAQVLVDGGFEAQSTTTLGDPWWIDSDDGNPPAGSTIEVELGTGEAFEGNNNMKFVTTDNPSGDWIAIGQDLVVEENTDYILTFYVKADNNIYWAGTPEWAKGYMGVSDVDGNNLGDPTVPHYWDRMNGIPWEPGEIIFGGGFDMSIWRDYHYIFNSGANTEVYLWIGTYVDNIVTWRLDGFRVAKLESADILQDGGFEAQSTTTLGDPWWIDSDDGNPPAGSTIEVELGTGQAFEGNNNLKFVTTDNPSGDWIAIGQDLTVEQNTDYVLVFHLTGDAILWAGTPEWAKGYMTVSDIDDNNLGDLTVAHYCDGEDAPGDPWAAGEIVFGEELMMDYWRDYIYEFNSGSNTEVYMVIGTYVDNVVTWRLDGFTAYKAVSLGTAIDETRDLVPSEHVLSQNYPNPFNPTTQIDFMLSNSENVKLVIYDVTGSKVRTLANEPRNLGKNTVIWDGRNDQGMEVPSGVYFYTLDAGKYSETKKMILLK
jgi:hypothetical protein